MRKLTLFATNYLFSFLLIWCLAAKAFGVTVNVSNATGQAGTLVSIPISVDNASGIAGVEIVLVFDQEILTALGAQTTSLTSGFAIVDSIFAGKIAITIAKATGMPGGNGSIIAVNFQVSSKVATGSTCSLNIQKVFLYDQYARPIAATALNGTFTVAKPSKITIQNAYNYPNPFDPQTEFTTFKYTLSDPVKVTITIFDLNGTLISTIAADVEKNPGVNVDNGQADIWDGRDQWGNIVAPGAYIYKIAASRLQVEANHGEVIQVLMISSKE